MKLTLRCLTQSEAFGDEESESEEEEVVGPGQKVAGAVSSWQRKKRAPWATPRPPRAEMFLCENLLRNLPLRVNA